MKKGAPFGNKNGASKHLWSNAIRKELTGKANAPALRKLARKLIAEANAGNMAAMKELGDRIDGKPMQSIEATGIDGGPIVMCWESPEDKPE